MIYNTREFKLKDGTLCTFRSPIESDASEMIDYLKVFASETDFILRYPEECTETDEEEAYFLKNINDSRYSMMIVAIIDGEIAGNCQLNIHKRMKARHRGNVAIGLKKKFWNKGIGTLMLQELEMVARVNGCKQLELEFIEGNTRAQALYEKMGFSIFGERKRAIILKDGTTLSDFFMVKFLD